ncbi:GNAT family N-acetyltransferase [Paenibacillus sp. NPDC056933]|uniref:GNAT family N-acetyltransferase n=1 Tax=Paenibacillus sp. NPDC056933 TaxID=3345968 RepID=UPI003639BDC7
MDGPRETVVFCSESIRKRSTNQQVRKEERTVRIYHFLGYDGRNVVIILAQGEIDVRAAAQQVNLQRITPENELACIQLKPREDQLNLVASNADSLIHATKEITSKPFGIFAEDRMVGFILFDNEIYNDGYYWILRFMIDEKYQGKGYAKLAIKEVISKLKERTDCKQIRVSHVPHNRVANALYKKSGFQETGEFEDNGDIILSYYLK